MDRNLRKNILFVHSGDSWIRGSEIVLFKVMSTLKDRSNSILVTNQTVIVNYANALGFKAIKISLNKFVPFYGDNNPFLYIKTIIYLLRLIKKYNIEIIYTTSAMSAQYCVPAAKFSGIKTITHIQQPEFLNLPLQMSMISLSDHILSVSETTAINFKEHNNLKVIYNGIDTERFKPSKNNKNILYAMDIIKKNEFVVGTVGSLIPRKRVDIFISAASMLAKLKDDIIFIVIGSGEMKKSLIKQSNNNGLEGRIFFLGERGDVHKFLPEFDVFVFPTEAEAFPLVALEAMSCEVPVIASGIPCLKESIEHGKNGLIVQDSTNPTKYAKNVIRLYDDESYRNQMKKNARMVVLSKFSEKVFINNIKDFYDNNISLK